MAQPPSQQQRLQQQWTRYVNRAVASGKRTEEIIPAMLEAKWPLDLAHEMIRQRASNERRKLAFMMAGFALLAIAATGVTVTTVSYALESGGEYFVWYGGIICGGIGFFWSLGRLLRIRV